MQRITSRDNSKLKLARKVREGRERGLVFVEGVRLAEEVLRSPDVRVSEAFVATAELADARIEALVGELESRGASVSEVPDALLAQIADTKSTQGLIVLCERPQTDFPAAFERMLGARPRLPVVVLLHEINNPSNLGAILRTVEAVDAAGVIVTRRSADVFSPKSLRASMGAAFRVPLATDATLDEALGWAASNGFRATAADVKATHDYTSLDWRTPRLLVFGSEAHGLTTADFGRIEDGVLIPMANGVESLNLAVSCGILLFEARKAAGA